MSRQLISRSPDLKRLQDEGYDLTIVEGYLLLRDVPYVTASGVVSRGVLVTELTLAGDITTTPKDHIAMFAGSVPCNEHGDPLKTIINASKRKRLVHDVMIDHTFSSKPPEGYTDFYHKMATYVALISNPARAIDSAATPKTFPAIETEDDVSPFAYVDTASSRAGISTVNDKLCNSTIGIIGLGGTGSYVLDLVSKTPVKQVHLWDGDRFLQHNAFRAPGAASIEQLKSAPNKATYFADLYSRMHKGVIAHDYYVDESNLIEVCEMDFVFVASGEGNAKKPTITRLASLGIPFIDVGMGVYEVDGALAGTVRVTTGTPAFINHITDRIPFSDGEANNDYSTNIQIADLNALNAALAVIKWKKLQGFYNDLDAEHSSIYEIDGNHITNEDCA